jgi:hypothetical protein
LRKWGYAINSYRNIANIHIDYGPWWAFAMDDLLSSVCDIIPAIPFPAFKMRLKDPGDVEFHGGEWTTWREWYGDLNQYFHLRVHNPVFYYCQDRIKTKSVDIPLAKARELFYEADRKFWDEEAARTAEMIQRDENT